MNLLRFKKKYILRNEESGEGVGGVGGIGDGGMDFDIESALASVSDGLGFEVETDDPAPAEPASTGDPADLAPADPKEDEAPVATDTPPPAAKVEAPKTWRPEAAAHFATLPEQVQQEILKREEDMFKGLEAYKADAGIGKAYSQAIAQYQPLLQQYNVDPVRLTSNLMQAHATLALGTPEQKQALFAKLAVDYGIQLPNAQSDDAPLYTDPAVQALQSEIKALKSQLAGTQQRQQQFDQARAEETRAKLQSEIDAFAKDPAHPYFDELTPDIVVFVKAGMSLKEAYEKAVWANPLTRAKEQERITAETAAKAQAEAKAKAEAARKATAANIRTSAKQASGTAPLGSIDETLQAAYARLSRKE